MTETTTPTLLRRSRTKRKISGVCGGVADYLGTDATLIRVLTVVSVFFTGGWALLAYVAAWLVMPEAQSSPYQPSHMPYQPSGAHVPYPPTHVQAPYQPNEEQDKARPATDI